MRIEDLDIDILKQMCVNHSFGLYKSEIIKLEVIGFIQSKNDEFINFTVVIPISTAKIMRDALSGSITQNLSYPMSEYMDILRMRREKKLNQLLDGN
jgi:hypothetical protein